MSTRIILKDVRLAFPDLWQPGKPIAGSTSGPKYGGNFLFAPGTEAAKEAERAFIEAANAKWGVNGMTVIQAIPNDKKCIRNGNANLDKEGNIRNGYAGMLYLVAKNKVRPVIVDRSRNPLVEADGKPYAGCYVNASVEVYAMDKPGQGKGIYATLLAVQFVRDGESFGGSSIGSADVFDDMGDEGEAPGAGAVATAQSLFG